MPENSEAEDIFYICIEHIYFQNGVKVNKCEWYVSSYTLCRYAFKSERRGALLFLLVNLYLSKERASHSDCVDNKI